MHLDEESQLVTFTTSITGPDGLTKKVVHTVREGDFLSLNGDTGEVLIGQLPLSPPSLESSQDTSNFMKWVDETRVIHVLANADSPIDAIEARRNGAQGIG
jgi:pyruvate,orthophosphate dikinase